MQTTQRQGLSLLRTRPGETPSRSALALSATLAALLLLALVAIPIHRSGMHWDFSGLREYWRLYLEGWKTTLAISAAALALSTVLGLLLALAKGSPWLPIQLLARTLIELLRGTPLLAQIYLLFYILAHSVHLENRYLAGTLILSLFSSAYLAEILRAGIESVSPSQIESAKALGFTPVQTYRHVLLPQALRSILPPLAGQFVSLIKDSSLLSIIGLNELTQNAKNVASYTFSNFESYFLLAAGYLLLTLPIALGTRWLEKKVRYEN